MHMSLASFYKSLDELKRTSSGRQFVADVMPPIKGCLILKPEDDSEAIEFRVCNSDLQYLIIIYIIS